jgi:hypothetical protein
MNEKLLYYLWQQQLTNKPMTTTDQRELVVVRAGQRNTNSGPDFLFAQLQLDKITWAGHVEMHIKSSDWYVHNHHVDKAYDNVILHVVWEEDMPVFASDDHPLATVVLRDFVDKTLIHRYQELSTSDLWIPCADRIKHIDRFKQMAFFDRLYLERLAQKTKVFQQWLDQTANDWENVLFIALAKGFGLSVNGLAFAAIAQSIPFSVIRKTQDHEELEALLFGQAEMLRAETDDAYLEKLQKKYRYAKHKLQLNEVNEKVKLFRMRPSSFPTIRLSQLAQLYALHSQLLNNILEGDPQKIVEEVFRVSTSDYWSTHHVFGKEHAKRNKGLSKSFLDLLIINTLIPYLFCYYKAHGINKTDELISWASSIQAESNSTIRAFSSLGVSAASALDSQALLQLKNAYCDQKKCLSCSFGQEFIQS